MKSRRLLVSLLTATTIGSVGLIAQSSPPAAAPAIKAEFVDPDSTDPEIVNVRKTGEDAINRLGYMLAQEITVAVNKQGAEAAIDVAHLKKLPKTNGRLNGLPNISAFKRTSLKLRDLGNAPDPAEDLALQQFLAEFSSGHAAPKLLVQKIENPNATKEWRVYRPFGALPICLTCHGDLSEQTQEFRDKIDRLYPVDKAFGYGANEWRGVLRVTVDLSAPPEPKPATPPAPAKAAPKKKS